MRKRLAWLKVWLGFLTFVLADRPALSADGTKSNLVAAILSESVDEQLEIIKNLGESSDPFVQQGIAAWRLGNIYFYETKAGRQVPFILDAATDADGKAKGLTLLDHEPIRDEAGEPVLFLASDLTAVETNSKLRKAIRTTLDLFALSNPNPKTRRDAVVKLGQEQNPEHLPNLKARISREKDPEVSRSLREAVALTETKSEDSATRNTAILELGEMHSITSVSFLKEMLKEAEAEPTKFGPTTASALEKAIRQIEEYQWWGTLFGTAFRGLSLAAVLLVAALGLAITFGLMGIINMAHGEVIMVGAYTTFVVQNVFRAWFGPASTGFNVYFIPALVTSFIVGAVVGIILERGIIRFLYSRPLESMLATWGVSLVLQQIFRHIFGAANVQVSSPSWLSGSFVIKDVLLAYNRLFVIAFAVFIVVGTWQLLTRTALGLQIRAVMQNRSMASCLGVRTDSVNMLTFAFGSGLAGMAGACLSQIGNVGPSLGQNYIIDCFMIVVLGGVGNVAGTVSAALGVGVTDQILQPWLGAVLGKITVLAAIILFLQWRPAGLFVTHTRSLEG